MFRKTMLAVLFIALAAPTVAFAGTKPLDTQTIIPPIIAVDDQEPQDAWQAFDVYQTDTTALTQGTIYLDLPNIGVTKFKRNDSLTGSRPGGYFLWYGTTYDVTDRHAWDFCSTYLVTDNDGRLYGSVSCGKNGYEIYPYSSSISIIAELNPTAFDGSAPTCDDNDPTNMCTLLPGQTYTGYTIDPAITTIKVGVLIGANATMQVKMNVNGNWVEVSVIPWVMGSITRANDVFAASDALGTNRTFDFVGHQFLNNYDDLLYTLDENYEHIRSTSSLDPLANAQHSFRSQKKADIVLLWVQHKPAGGCDKVDPFPGGDPQPITAAFGVAGSNTGCETNDGSPQRALSNLLGARNSTLYSRATEYTLYPADANKWTAPAGSSDAGDINVSTNGIDYSAGFTRLKLISNDKDPVFSNSPETDEFGNIIYAERNNIPVKATWPTQANLYEACYQAYPALCTVAP